MLKQFQVVQNKIEKQCKIYFQHFDNLNSINRERKKYIRNIEILKQLYKRNHTAKK